MKWIALLPCLLLASACGGGGNVDCGAHIDRQYECGLLPAETADQFRDINVRICEQRDSVFKDEVNIALDECTEVPCADMIGCVVQANQLCQSDVSAQKSRVCVKAVECGWEELTTMQQCVDELAVEGLYMCLKPDVLEAYVGCVENIDCGPDSEDEWYACGFKHIGL